MITEEAPASLLALTAREKVPKFADLLWHCFRGASRSRKFRSLRIRLLWPHRACIRHLGKKPSPADPGQLHTKPQAQGASFWSQLKGPASSARALPYRFAPLFWSPGLFFWYCGTCELSMVPEFCRVEADWARGGGPHSRALSPVFVRSGATAASHLFLLWLSHSLR